MTEEEKRVFVTDDKGLRQPKVLSQTDMEIMKEVQGGGGIPIKSLDELKELARAAGERFDEFEKLCDGMTLEQAEVVRKLRVEKGYSWRAVAQACYDWGWGEWYPPSNQIMGMALCERAAEFFNEDYMKPPWN
jgi:hypothetical protein